MDIATPEGMAQAVAWQTNHIVRLKSCGVWVVPRSLTVITINKEAKIASFSGYEPDIEKVFLAMGWAVAKPIKKGTE